MIKKIIYLSGVVYNFDVNKFKEGKICVECNWWWSYKDFCLILVFKGRIEKR